ncbi:MAG: hypothetical protein JSR58_07245 [Verrucomicrobia bacterium]|nr:hypothetical protein [Verrucomicrobiota bacterium]
MASQASKLSSFPSYSTSAFQLDPSIDELDASSKLNELKKNRELSQFIEERKVDSPPVTSSCKILQRVVQKVYAEAQVWSTTVSQLLQRNRAIPLSELTYQRIFDLFFDTLHYSNLSRIFESHEKMSQFKSRNFETLGSMCGFWKTAANLEFIIPNREKIAHIGPTLLNHCAKSKSTKISLMNCMGDKMPQFDHAATVTYLDLSWNRLNTADLSSFANLEELHIHHNQLKEVPKNLPDSLEVLDISGNRFIPKLDFDKLPPALFQLNISYMSGTIIPDSFWNLLSGKEMTLKVSTDMTLSVPKGFDDSKLTIIDQFDRTASIEDQEVVFAEIEEEEEIPELSSKSSTHSSQRSEGDDPDEEENSWSLFKTLSGLAIVGAMLYGLYRLWNHWKKA